MNLLVGAAFAGGAAGGGAPDFTGMTAAGNNAGGGLAGFGIAVLIASIILTIVAAVMNRADKNAVFMVLVVGTIATVGSFIFLGIGAGLHTAAAALF